MAHVASESVGLVPDVPLEGEVIPAITVPRTSSKQEPKSVALWNAYAIAYQDRYGVPPIRNAKVNRQLYHVIDRIGSEEAPAIAQFYLTHNNAWYVKNGHSVQCLLNDAEKLRTEWATQRQITTQAAREIDQRQTTLNSYERLAAKYAALDQARAQEACHAH